MLLPEVCLISTFIPSVCAHQPLISDSVVNLWDIPSRLHQASTLTLFLFAPPVLLSPDAAHTFDFCAEETVYFSGSYNLPRHLLQGSTLKFEGNIVV